ncbi:MAG: carbohydrate binding family 9 domain-containing protein [Oligoflexia bacterium]|nr:carbohydrate binding family 9 domain-containing protein [Oligoflexia bacterium]
MPLTPNMDLPRVAQAEIVIDGRADEAAWEDAARTGPFLTFSPVPGQQPVGDTQVRLLSDDHALYLLIEVSDPEPQRVRATVGRRDTRFDDDFVGFYLDLGAKAQRAYVFIVNPLGLQADGVATASSGEDFSWDTRWQSMGRRTDQGYLVEIAIPWRSIRHERKVQRLGFLAFRKRAATAEKSSWPVIDPEVQGLMVQEAVLNGPGLLDRTVGLDITPELTFGWTDQGADDSRFGVAGVSPGLTVQWAPTPADSVMATLNPDFSQVESDEAQIAINRRYALYYDEKRPFFLEGQEWFDSPLGDIVYTRSMVAPGAGLRATAAHGGWALAALNVWDRSPAGSVSEGGGWTDTDLAGHDAVDTLLRGRASLGSDGYLGTFFSDKTVLGAVGTGAHLANRVAGADARIRVSDRFVVETAGAASYTSLSDGSEMVGPAAALTANYESEHFFANADAQLIGPDFRAENGFLTYADRVGSSLQSGFLLFPNGKLVRRIRLRMIDTDAYWHTDGRLRELYLQPNISWTWGNGVFTYVEYQYDNELYLDDLFTYQRVDGGFGGQFSRWLGLNAFAGAGQAILYDPEDPRLGQQTWVSVGPNLQPASWLELNAELAWERFDEAQHGAKVYDGWTARFKAQAFASRSVWARLLIDRDTFANLTTGEALVAWEPTPGRAIYLGAGSQFQADPSWGIFAKASWVFSG